MSWAARSLVFAALCLLPGLPSQEPQAAPAKRGKLVAPGRLVVAGRKLSCGSTPTLIREFEGIAASSTVIMLNMTALAGLPRKAQWLIYYHECGHILYGPKETAADCYAVRRARRERWLTQESLADICTVFNIAGHGPVHPDPQDRCNQLRQCFFKIGSVRAGGN
jgi:hypothetical protein